MPAVGEVAPVETSRNQVWRGTMVEDYRVRLVVQAVELNPATTVAELARLVRLSSSRLGHLFKLQVGHDLEDFLRNARLEKAAELLRTTELSIKEIAAQVGYRHASSLDRGFKHVFGFEPADYRRRHRNLTKACG